MGQSIKRLPDTELEVMLRLWETSENTPRSWLDEQLKEKGWASNTINTYLVRLLEKGFISCERRGKTNYYTPIIGREEYLEFENKTFLSKLYGSSLKNFVALLCKADEISETELDELQELLGELKRRK